MPTQEAKDYYYNKGKQDFLVGFYDQPFPGGIQMELDEFEKLCNRAYKNGYGDAQEELKRR